MMLQNLLNAGPVWLSMAALSLGIVVNVARAQCHYEVTTIIKVPQCGELLGDRVNHGPTSHTTGKLAWKTS